MGNSCARGAGTCRSNKTTEKKSFEKRNDGFFSVLDKGRSNKTTEKKSFKWRIDGFFSLLDKGAGWTYSRVFAINGFDWYLRLNPMDKKSGDAGQYVSLGLELSKNSLKTDTVVQASFKFLIYDQSYGKHSEYQVSHDFQTASTSAGTSCMIPLETLKNPSSGLLINDCCIFGVEFINVATVKTDTISESLFVQKRKICGEKETYTWNIEDFFALKDPCSSSAFEAGGYKWFLSMYPSGTSCSKNFVPLYLNLDKSNKLTNTSGILVEMRLFIKNQESGKHRKLEGRCQFSEGAAAGAGRSSSRWRNSRIGIL